MVWRRIPGRGGLGDLKGSRCGLNLSRELVGGDEQGSESPPPLGSAWGAPASKVKKCKLFSCVQLSVTPWTAACQAPLFMEFFRLECWSGFPSPGDLYHPGIESESPTFQADSLPSELPGNGQQKPRRRPASRTSGPSDCGAACTSAMVTLEPPGASFRKRQKQADRAWAVKSTRKRAPRFHQPPSPFSGLGSPRPGCSGWLSWWVDERPCTQHACPLNLISYICEMEIFSVTVLCSTGFCKPRSARWTEGQWDTEN